jgi:hypothetical protein
VLPIGLTSLPDVCRGYFPLHQVFLFVRRRQMLWVTEFLMRDTKGPLRLDRRCLR